MKAQSPERRKKRKTWKQNTPPRTEEWIIWEENKQQKSRCFGERKRNDSECNSNLWTGYIVWWLPQEMVLEKWRSPAHLPTHDRWCDLARDQCPFHLNSRATHRRISHFCQDANNKDESHKYWSWNRQCPLYQQSKMYMWNFEEVSDECLSQQIHKRRNRKEPQKRSVRKKEKAEKRRKELEKKIKRDWEQNKKKFLPADIDPQRPGERMNLFRRWTLHHCRAQLWTRNLDSLQKSWKKHHCKNQLCRNGHAAYRQKESYNRSKQKWKTTKNKKRFERWKKNGFESSSLSVCVLSLLSFFDRGKKRLTEGRRKNGRRTWKCKISLTLQALQILNDWHRSNWHGSCPFRIERESSPFEFHLAMKDFYPTSPLAGEHRKPWQNWIAWHFEKCNGRDRRLKGGQNTGRKYNAEVRNAEGVSWCARKSLSKKKFGQRANFRTEGRKVFSLRTTVCSVWNRNSGVGFSIGSSEIPLAWFLSSCLLSLLLHFFRLSRFYWF